MKECHIHGILSVQIIYLDLLELLLEELPDLLLMLPLDLLLELEDLVLLSLKVELLQSGHGGR